MSLKLWWAEGVTGTGHRVLWLVWGKQARAADPTPNDKCLTLPPFGWSWLQGAYPAGTCPFRKGCGLDGDPPLPAQYNYSYAAIPHAMVVA